MHPDKPSIIQTEDEYRAPGHGRQFLHIAGADSQSHPGTVHSRQNATQHADYRYDLTNIAAEINYHHEQFVSRQASGREYDYAFDCRTLQNALTRK